MRILLACLLVCAACGDSSTTPAADMAVAPDLAPSTEVCMPDGKPVALDGQYAIRALLHVHAKIPADGTLYDKDVMGASQVLLLATVKQASATLTVTAKACDIKLPKVGIGNQPPTEMTIDPALLATVPTVSSTATLEGTMTCASVASTPIAIVLGARLPDASMGMLPAYDSTKMPPAPWCGGAPTTACDAATDENCVCDQEKDGEPGATVGAMNIPVLTDIDKIYLALRTGFSLSGMVFPSLPMQSTAGQRLKGQVTSLALEQSPVGCHRSSGDCDNTTTGQMVALNPVISQSATTPSTFVAVPVPSVFTCADVVAEESTLFAGE